MYATRSLLHGLFGLTDLYMLVSLVSACLFGLPAWSVLVPYVSLVTAGLLGLCWSLRSNWLGILTRHGSDQGIEEIDSRLGLAVKS